MKRSGPAEAGTAGSPCFGQGETAAIDPAELAFARDVACFHRLGPLALCEFLAELGMRRLLQSEIEALVQYYLCDREPGRG
jgi:hypothetical protein